MRAVLFNNYSIRVIEHSFDITDEFFIDIATDNIINMLNVCCSINGTIYSLKNKTEENIKLIKELIFNELELMEFEIEMF